MSGAGALADGFLRGFQTMNNYERGKADDARRDKALQMQEQNNQARLELARSADKRSADLAASQEKERQQRMKLAGNQDARAQAEADYRNEQRKEQNWMAKNGAFIKMAYADPKFATDHAKEFNKVFGSKYGQKWDPRRYASDEGKAASKTVLQHLSAVTSSLKNGDFQKLSHEQQYQYLNDPSAIKAANFLMQADLQKGVGEPDANTGEVIKKKELSSFIQGPNGSLIPELKITYADGKTVLKPMTEGRDSNPDAPVKQINPNDLITYFGTQALVGRMYSSGTMDAAAKTLGLRDTGDVKGYRKQVADARERAIKDERKVADDASLSPEQVKEKQQAIEAGYAKLQQDLQGVYGLRESQGNTDTAHKKLSKWAMASPDNAKMLMAVAKSSNPKVAAMYKSALANDDPALMQSLIEGFAKQQEQDRVNQANARTMESILGASQGGNNANKPGLGSVSPENYGY